MLQPFAAVLAGLMLVGTVAAQTLVVRADHWMPLNGTPDAPRPGFAIEILHHIFGAHDIRVDYQLDSWTRSVRQARNGDIDCVVGAYRGEAPDLMYPQQPLGYDETAFYVLSEDAWRYQGVESLEGQRLGVIDGYNYGTPLDEWLATPEGERAAQAIHGREPLKRNLRMLLAGRLDVIVESPFVMQALLRDLGLSEVVREAGRLQSPPTPLYVAFSPARETSARYLELFDHGMERLRESGELARIMARYGLKEPAMPGTPAADALSPQAP